MSSFFLHNEPCPKCRERGKDKHGNNLGVFSDGHVRCWSCGYYKGASTVNRAQAVLLQQEEPIVPLEKQMYKGACEPGISKEIYLTHLAKYGIMFSECTEYDLCYNYQKELLVFHYPDWSFWNGRYIGSNIKHPKYISSGSKFNTLYVFNGNRGQTTDELILCEDYISAIKLGRVVSTLCLFGTAIPLELIIRLATRFSKVGIWLDMDKAKESLLERSKASGIFDQGARSIITEKDPKYYSTEEIKEILGYETKV